ncbi:WcaG Nucleoside-diphosphate-sugar epimerases [Comamonadaceae bacterium]
MKIIVTGTAGFIGMHTCLRLLERGDEVFGIDNLNDYYEVSLKEARLKTLLGHRNFKFKKIDVAHTADVNEVFESFKPERVVHLAAQAGVRYSIQNPKAYLDSNLVGFGNILEGCRHNEVEHLVYASSSSVYGGNTNMPFSEHDSVNHPVSLYAATKKANELMAHTYSHLFRLPTTGLRFFTVYGPWGRPDMAPILFTKAILAGKAIDVFNYGNMKRDFTFVDDIVEGVIRVLDKPAQANESFDSGAPDAASSHAPYRIFNIGNNTPTPLLEFIDAIETSLGKVAVKNLLPIQPGDVETTAANTDELNRWVEFKPKTDIRDGVAKFVDWYKSYYEPSM